MRAALFDQLDLRDVTLVCQDWGGLIGLRLVGEHPDRFARVVVANTFLPTGDTPPGDGVRDWWRTSRRPSRTSRSAFIVSFGCATDTRPTTVVAAYDAPFPDDSYKAGARQFPMLVPTAPDDPASAANRKAWETLRAFDEAVPHRVLRRGPDHARRRRSRSSATCPAARASRTPRSKAAATSCKKTAARQLAKVVVDWMTRGSSTDRLFALLDEVRAIARTGLHYSDNPFDRARYERLLELASRGVRRRIARSTPPRCARASTPRSVTRPRRSAPTPRCSTHDDRILLVRPRRRRQVGTRSRAGSTPTSHRTQTVVRELAEEAGVRGRVDRLVGVFFAAAHTSTNIRTAPCRCVYLCSIIGGALRPQPHEVLELAWRDIDDVAARRVAPCTTNAGARRARRALAPAASAS